jgi:short-subunit dehydrogenase
MKDFAGKTAILTGANGGLGVYISQALADLGMQQALVAYPGAGLEEMRAALEKRGIKAMTLVKDLRQAAQRIEVVEQVTAALGPIDVLVNNAGIEFTAPYHALTLQNIEEVISVNLEAPMLLTRLVLPEMLKRGRGHIINMSSLAGRSGPAYQEPYAATKAGLVGFTTSLRASCRGSGVSASVICPGFIEAGIYKRLKERSGQAAPALLGSSPPEKIIKAVIRCLEKDVPEVIINRYPVRPLFALTALLPSVGEWITHAIGAHEFFRRVYAESEKKAAK